MDTPPADPSNPPTQPSETPPSGPTNPPAPVAPASPPPAAQIVQDGTKTERELALERDLKAREQRLAELEDENRQLKTVTPPADKSKADKQKKSFLSGGTFFDEEEA